MFSPGKGVDQYCSLRWLPEVGPLCHSTGGRDGATNSHHSQRAESCVEGAEGGWISWVFWWLLLKIKVSFIELPYFRPSKSIKLHCSLSPCMVHVPIKRGRVWEIKRKQWFCMYDAFEHCLDCYPFFTRTPWWGYFLFVFSTVFMFYLHCAVQSYTTCDSQIGSWIGPTCCTHIRSSKQGAKSVCLQCAWPWDGSIPLPRGSFWNARGWCLGINL